MRSAKSGWADVSRETDWGRRLRRRPGEGGAIENHYH
nr:MAG TPA: hypothetical protein [Caudoviricetes sp.]